GRPCCRPGRLQRLVRLHHALEDGRASPTPTTAQNQTTHLPPPDQRHAARPPAHRSLRRRRAPNEKVKLRGGRMDVIPRFAVMPPRQLQRLVRRNSRNMGKKVVTPVLSLRPHFFDSTILPSTNCSASRRKA